MAPLATLLVFLATATVVVLAGTSLARNGDVIAARTKLGGLFVGSLFLAGATSLPELATDVAAVRLGAPDLAAGDLFGSSMANMLILAIVSMLPRAELFRRAALDGVLAAALAIVVTCIAAMFVLIHGTRSVLGFGPGSLVLAATYIVGSRAIFQQTTLARTAGVTEEMGGSPPAPEAAGESAAVAARAGTTVRRAAWRFAAASGIILLAAPFFARSAESIATLTGLGTSFVGIWLVGMATSLPELVTSIAAVRMRAYDLAVGNLFGSNAFNMLMFLPLDLAHPGGPILGAVSEVHALAALVAVVLMGIALAAMIYRAEGRLRMLEPSGLLMVLAYVLGLGLVFAQASR